jgi:hypothetical protein
MLTLTLTAILLSQSAELLGAPREWTEADPEVRFVEGTTAPPIKPLAGWRGRAEISVRCTVEANGVLDDCAVVRQSPRHALSHRSARSAVQGMRLLLGATGPAPGDGFTITVVVTSYTVRR